MQRFYPIIQAGRRPRHRLSGIMRGGFVLVLSALMLPAAANATAESSVTGIVLNSQVAVYHHFSETSKE